MKPLAYQFKSGGFMFQILRRNGRVVLLEKRKAGGKSRSWEVVKTVVRPSETLMGVFYPEREAMPSSSQWGKLGWTFVRLADAEGKYQRLVNAGKRRGNGRGIAEKAAFTTRQGHECSSPLPRLSQTNRPNIARLPTIGQISGGEVRAASSHGTKSTGPNQGELLS